MNSNHLWTLTDGHAGNRRQAGALAAALDAGAIRDWSLVTRAPWRWAAPRCLPGSEAAFGPALRHRLASPPPLVIGCGRQGALATRLCRARGARAVQILDPRIDPRHWDLVIAPQHDRLRGPNVLTVQGSLNPVDDAWLADARAHFAHFADLPRPRTAVLLGGSSAHVRFDRSAFEVLASRLAPVLAREGGSVMVTASRRTPTDVVGALRPRYLETPGVVWCGDGDGDNPYPGMLAWADRIVVTPDSVNMVSEACATAAPVFVFDPGRVRGRPRLFLEALLQCGRIRAMDARLDAFEAEPLRETARVAAEVRERLELQPAA